MDDIRRWFSLELGTFGMVLQDGEYRAVDSQIGFVAGQGGMPDALLCGTVGDAKGIILDLGDIRHASTATSFLPALIAAGNEIKLRDPHRYGLTSERIVDRLPEPSPLARCPIVPGHVYFVAVQSGGSRAAWFLRIVKHVPGQAIGITWIRARAS